MRSKVEVIVRNEEYQERHGEATINLTICEDSLSKKTPVEICRCTCKAINEMDAPKNPSGCGEETSDGNWRGNRMKLHPSPFFFLLLLLFFFPTIQVGLIIGACQAQLRSLRPDMIVFLAKRLRYNLIYPQTLFSTKLCD